MGTKKQTANTTSDGHTFLAVTMGAHCGSWHIGVDLEQVIQKVNSKGRNIVQVYYGKRDSMSVNDFGNIVFDAAVDKPTPIGLFLANINRIKFLKKGEVYKYFPNAQQPNHDDTYHQAWVKKQLEIWGC